MTAQYPRLGDLLDGLAAGRDAAYEGAGWCRRLLVVFATLLAGEAEADTNRLASHLLQKARLQRRE